jgi:hypothetical protein
MAPIPASTVSRLKVKYTGPQGNHTMLFHGKVGVSEADLIASARVILTPMTGLVYGGTTFDNADYAVAGSNLYFPVSWTPIVSASSATWSDADGYGKFLQWGGRGADGVRAKWYLFETSAALKKDMRWNRGESAGIDDVMDALLELDEIIGTVSGSTYSVYNYANVNFNDKAVAGAR